MQKIIKISCCAECPAQFLKSERIPYCRKMNQRIEEESKNPVNPALIGFPEWCPLETVKSAETITDYTQEIRNIMKIVTNAVSPNVNPDAIQEAAYYLNAVIENAMKKAETG